MNTDPKSIEEMIKGTLWKNANTFLDLWMESKIELLRKLKKRIKKEKNPKKLKKLSDKLNDAIFSEKDLLAICKKNAIVVKILEGVHVIRTGESHHGGDHHDKPSRRKPQH